MSSASIVEELYAKLTNEEDARVCTDISDEACSETPGNFVRILGAYFFSKLGDAIGSPKTVLAWVMGTVGAPAFMLGLLVPIRESGSLIPQLVIAGFVRRLSVRKWVWVTGSLIQAATLMGLGLVVASLEGAAAGWAILALLVLFSLARGFCSVAAKDVIGKTVPKTRRGRLTGWSASAAGLVTLGVGTVLLLPRLQSGESALYGLLLAGAGALWILAAMIYATVREFPGETGGGGNAAVEAVRRLEIIRSDKPFRNFVIARALLMCSALSSPFYIALAQQNLGSPTYLLGLFVLAGGLASLVSAPVWGQFADQSSKQVMVAAALVTAGIGLVTFVVDRFVPGLAASLWFLPAAYFVLSLAHSGVRVGRKTYVVDLASGNRRTDYVAVSNTIIGILLLAAGSIGALAPVISNAGVIAVLALLGLAGAVLSRRLPEVQQ